MKKKNKKSKKGLSQPWKNVIFNVSFTLTAILIVILFYDRILVTAILEAILGIIGLIKWNSKITVSIYVIGGIGGALMEMLVIHASRAWLYKSPGLLTIVPIWLIFMWGNVAAYLFETGKELRKITNEK